MEGGVNRKKRMQRAPPDPGTTVIFSSDSLTLLLLIRVRDMMSLPVSLAVTALHSAALLADRAFIARFRCRRHCLDAC
jgi:hypothetical protein